MLQALQKWWAGPAPVDSAPLDWSWTPDQWVLEQFFHQLMFIPDAMKDSEQLRDISVEVLNPICYTHANYLAFKRDLGVESYPVFLPGDFKPTNFLRFPPEPAKVQGELHLVESNKIYLLDKLRQNGVQFTRQRIRVTYPWRFVAYGRDHPIPRISSHGFVTVSAWMYIALPHYWDPMIGGIFAQPMQLYEHEGKPRPWIGKFSKF